MMNNLTYEMEDKQPLGKRALLIKSKSIRKPSNPSRCYLKIPSMQSTQNVRFEWHIEKHTMHLQQDASCMFLSFQLLYTYVQSLCRQIAQKY